MAVVSAGAGNPYGHPAPATIDRLAARGSRVLRTDRNGSVELTLDGATQLEVRAERRDVAVTAGRTAARDRWAAADPTLVTDRAAVGEPVGSTVLARPRAAFTCGIPTATG